MTLETISTINQVLVVLTSSGLLGLAYLTGKIIQRINQLETIQTECFRVCKNRTEDTFAIKIDVAEIKQIIANQSRDFDLIKEHLMKGN